MGSISVKKILKALLFGCISTALLLILLAAVCSAIDPERAVIRTATSVISMVCVFLCCFVSARGIERGGMLHGGITALLYSVIFVCLCAVYSGGSVFTPHTASMLIFVMLSGVLGGVVGINSAR